MRLMKSTPIELYVRAQVVVVMGRAWVYIVVAAAVGCGAANDELSTRQRDCGVAAIPSLTDSGVGALRVGASVGDVRAACTVLEDRVLAEGREGMPERRLTVVLGSVSTTSTVANGRVWRIEIASPRFRTRDSLGVGTTAGRLRRMGATFVAGEDANYALIDQHCGLSFQLPDRGGAQRIPDSARVTTVLVFGCQD